MRVRDPDADDLDSLADYAYCTTHTRTCLHEAI
jgi:hypothetical protein